MNKKIGPGSQFHLPQKHTKWHASWPTAIFQRVWLKALLLTFNAQTRTSLVIQCLRLRAPAGKPGSIPGQRASSHMLQLSVHMLQPRSHVLPIHATMKIEDPCFRRHTGQPNKIKFKMHMDSRDRYLGEKSCGHNREGAGGMNWKSSTGIYIQ